MQNTVDVSQFYRKLYFFTIQYIFLGFQRCGWMLQTDLCLTLNTRQQNINNTNIPVSHVLPWPPFMISLESSFKEKEFPQNSNDDMLPWHLVGLLIYSALYKSSTPFLQNLDHLHSFENVLQYYYKVIPAAPGSPCGYSCIRACLYGVAVWVYIFAVHICQDSSGQINVNKSRTYTIASDPARAGSVLYAEILIIFVTM